MPQNVKRPPETPRIDDVLPALYARKRGSRPRAALFADFKILLDRLGNPHHRLPPVIHVAGSSGKGSTIAFLNAVITRARYRAHVYTSPHLLDYAERFVLAGSIVDADLLARAIAAVTAAADGLDLGFLYLTPAIGFLLFSQTPADILLLETGMGGRLDPTNVIDNPLVTIITRICHDHMNHLGHDLTAIAAEKSGIIKPGCPVVTIRHPDKMADEKIRAVMDGAAGLNQAPVIIANPEDVRGFTLGLAGAHQAGNAALALRALKCQSCLTIPDTAMTDGLRLAIWPGRLHRLTADDTGWSLWFDGGHNEAAAEILRDWITADGVPTHIIIAMALHKDIGAFARILAPVARSITPLDLTPFDGGSMPMHPPQAIARVWAENGVNLRPPAPTIAHAVTALKQDYPFEKQSKILICGSLFLARRLAQQPL